MTDQQSGHLTDDLESVALRPMIIDGQEQTDDYEAIWRDIAIGRMLKQADSQHWFWSCNVHGQAPSTNDRGPAINFKDCQVRFKLAWKRIRASLTEEAIAIATKQVVARQPPSGAEGIRPRDRLVALDNKRAAPRQRVLKAGTIEFGGGTIDCTVRNVSETGAALEVFSPLGIPSEFTLLISGDHTYHQCQVMWRKENRMGVAFQ